MGYAAIQACNGCNRVLKNSFETEFVRTMQQYIRFRVNENNHLGRANFWMIPQKDVCGVFQHPGKAVELYERERPHLVLIDLMMPEVSGFDVVAALQRNTDTASIPILVVIAKQITALDRAARNNNPGKVIHIDEKAGLNNARFIAEVRRVLLPN